MTSLALRFAVFFTLFTVVLVVQGQEPPGLPRRATVRDLPDSRYYYQPTPAPDGVIVRRSVHPVRWAQLAVIADAISTCVALSDDEFTELNIVYGGSGCEVIAPVNAGIAWFLNGVAGKDKERCGHWKIESDKKKLRRCRRGRSIGWIIFGIRAPVAARNSFLILDK